MTRSVLQHRTGSVRPTPARRRAWTHAAAILLLAALLPAGEASADDDAPAGINGEAQATAQWARGEFQRMTCRLPPDSTGATTELQPERQSLLTWTNPEVGRIYGELFLWTQDGRPAVVLSIYEAHSPWKGRTAEFRLLSSSPPVVEHAGRTVWTPVSGDVEWKLLPRAPAPGATPAARLRQMRQLAGRFSAVLTDRRSELTGDLKQLRLLTQPLYRYPSPTKEDNGGAMFALVTATDPELFLLIESREGADGPAWQYALARMNRDALEVRLDGGPIWSAKHLVMKDLMDSRRPYCGVELPAEAAAPAP
jgi:hypothetical protein